MTQMRKHLDEPKHAAAYASLPFNHNNVKERFQPKGLAPRSREAGLYANLFLNVKPGKKKFSKT